MLFAERTVIEKNLQQYMELLAHLDARPPEPETELIATNARLMAQTQIEKIRQYPFSRRRCIYPVRRPTHLRAFPIAPHPAKVQSRCSQSRMRASR